MNSLFNIVIELTLNRGIVNLTIPTLTDIFSGDKEFTVEIKDFGFA